MSEFDAKDVEALARVLQDKVANYAGLGLLTDEQRQTWRELATAALAWERSRHVPTPKSCPNCDYVAPEECPACGWPLSELSEEERETLLRSNDDIKMGRLHDHEDVKRELLGEDKPTEDDEKAYGIWLKTTLFDRGIQEKTSYFYLKAPAHITTCVYEHLHDAYLAACARLRGEMDRIIEAAIKIAVLEERQKCADTAWEMQMHQFGGGTAIGNQIAEGRHIQRGQLAPQDKGGVPS